MEEFKNSDKGRVTIYTIQGCPHCKQAKAILARLEVPVCVVDLNEHPELQLPVKKLTGRVAVPQIFFNSQYVGGIEQFQKLSPEELEKLVKMVKEEPLTGAAPPLPETKRSQGASLEMEDFKNSDKGRVTIYTIQGCPHCKQAKAILARLEVPVCVVDLNEHPELQLPVKKLTGRVTVPQIFFNSQYVGGNEKLQKLSPEELEKLVKMVREEPLTGAALPLPETKRPQGASLDTDRDEKPAELSLQLRELILKLFSEHLSDDGKSVDYKGMSANSAFERYTELAIQLQRVELLSLSREETLAFFINIYNALVIHGFLRIGAPTNILQRYRFFNYVSYLIGGEVYTLQDIENGVLRGNRKGVGQLRRPFSKTDPRLQVALKDAEPLIHFALNCGAKGCPPIKTYTPENIDQQLRTAAEAFLENDDACVVDSGKKEVRLSSIFKWYKVDFGGTDENLLQWVLKHMSDSPKKTSLKGVLGDRKVKVSYLPYDWSSNSSH
ncbi:uncharacterized protein zgc:152951 isoform X2 [Corythoichthys intestinalis]|uniref:uncharacterized protein zgc:152951 isoform X2 n=1 Tax=Corythoichthys intestinalis TaxID=161448 RepID=UPI0025A5DF54|nr:uncharacterized protein zgc:152951 isoform X2 [Corythoichthys intestinalis]